MSGCYPGQAGGMRSFRCQSQIIPCPLYSCNKTFHPSFHVLGWTRWCSCWSHYKEYGFSERYPCFCSRPLHRSCSFPCKPLWGWVPSHCTMRLYIALRISKSTKCNLADPTQFWLKFKNFISVWSKIVQTFRKNIPIWRRIQSFLQ